MTKTRKRISSSQDVPSQTQNGTQEPSSSQELNSSQILNFHDNQIRTFVFNTVKYVLRHARNSRLVQRKNIITFVMKGNNKVANTVFEKVRHVLSKVNAYIFLVINYKS